MKKIFSVILSLVILFSTMGFTVSTHMCGGKRVKSKLMIGNADVSCGMEKKETPCSKQTTMKSNCCQNEYQTFSIEDDYTQQLVKTDLNFDFVISFISTWVNLFDSLTTQNDIFRDHSPPPLIRNIPILIQSFLI